MNKITRTALAGLAGSALVTASAEAAPFSSLYAFGDSYSDTGAYVPLTDGSTAVGYLADNYGITLVTSGNPAPGTNGINFAQSGARVDVGSSPSGAQPQSLTQQVAAFSNAVTSGSASFDPSTSLFFLAGGLNDHRLSSQESIARATASQVATLYALGARYFQIALLPSLVPAYADSASFLNPGYSALVPQLQGQYEDAVVSLSNWGTYYDDIIRDPARYGITNTTDQCFNFDTNRQECSTPGSYFYSYALHPSAAAHRIVGDRLYQEALSLPTAGTTTLPPTEPTPGPTPVPEPASIALFGMGIAGLAMARRRRPG